MDRNTVTGLLLIFVITIAWAWFTMPSEEELARRQAEQATQDSIAAAQAEQQSDSLIAANQDTANQTNGTEPQGDDSEQTENQGSPIIGETQRELNMGAFSAASFADTVYTMVQTEKYSIEMTNLGAGPSRIILKDHQTWDQQQVQMIRNTAHSAYSLGFLSSQNFNIETDKLVFEPLTETETIEISGGESAELSYRLALEGDSELIFNYTFFGNQYSYNLDIRLVNMQDYISGTNVDFGWTAALNLTEQDRAQDAQATAAYVFAGGELEKFQVPEAEQTEQRINGTIDWVSTRSRFFGTYIKPVTNSNAAILRGEDMAQGGLPETYYRYQAAVQSSYVQSNELSYELYSGPLRYHDLNQFDEHAYDVVEIGYAIFRWFADPLVRYLIIPFFAFGSSLVSNYGILIILFGVIVKLLLFPLTQKSFKSMAAMKELQPKMKEIQEKYEDDPQKQQKETIALYKKAGVNPLGGCLPMLMQFPILITLFYFFQNSMIIRQESFLWASDLSAPDYILSLPFSLPVIGDQIAGFVLLMSVAMFFQSKLSGGMSGGAAPSGGPNMKGFMYLMPVIMLVVFNNFAAGLSLYYLVYNVLSIAQQAYINKVVKGGNEG
ncbi:MAG: membrane protein insertase YidC [Bacteroidetes bacterium]|nr:membrane protein insertase YidC [Bacteroidota bacterium]